MNELAMKKAEILLNEYIRDRKRDLADRIIIDPRFR